MAEAHQIVGTVSPGEREHRPAAPVSSWRDSDARGTAHVCIDCGEAGPFDASQTHPFDQACESCLSIRADVQRRIDRAVQAFLDVEVGLSDTYTLPVRPAWAKWRRLRKTCAHCGETKPERAFAFGREPYVPEEFEHWCRPCMVAEGRRRSGRS